MSDLKITLALDDQSFDQSFKRLQDKVNSLRKGTDVQLSPAAQQQQAAVSGVLKDRDSRLLKEELEKYQKISKELDFLTKKHEFQNKLLKETNDILAKQEIERKKLNTQSEVELKLLKQKESELKILQKDGTVPGVIATPAGVAATPAGSPPPGGGFGGMLQNFLKGAAAKAIVDGVFNISQQIITAESRGNIAVSQTSAMAARPLREAMGGKGADFYYYGDERRKAFEMAEKQSSRQDISNTLLGAGGAVAGGAAGAKMGFTAGGIAAGALTAATFGAAAPLTPFLMAGGTALGGYLGAQGGAYLAGGEKTRSAIFDRDNYQKMMTKEGMQNYEAQFAAEKAKDPLKEAAMETMRSRNKDFLSIQRSTGLADRPTLQHLESNMGFGGGMYSMSNIMANQNQLMQQGALGSDLRGDLSGRAAAAQQYGITGAASIMGRISAAGGEGQTDDKFYRLLASAMTAGVNDSVLPQDINRFAQVAVGLATKGGGFSEEAIKTFASGLTDFSQRSMQAAAGAQSYLESVGGESEGFRGSIGLGFITGKAKDYFGEEVGSEMLQDPAFVEFLNTMTPAKLETPAGQRALKGMVFRFGVEPESIKQVVKDISESKRTMQTGKMSAQAAIDKMSEMTEGLSTSERQKVMGSGEYMALEMEATSRLQSEEGTNFKGRPLDEQQSIVRAMESEGIDFSEALEKTKEEFTGKKKSKFEDYREMEAKGDMVGLENLMNPENLMKVSNAAKTFNEQFDLTKLKFESFFKILKDNENVDLSTYKEKILMTDQERADRAAVLQSFAPNAGDNLKVRPRKKSE
jgi:hypothetical protein